jgi:gluconolactonase
MNMKSKRMLIITMGVLGAAAALIRAQAPAPAPALRTGPGVQAANDAKEPEVLATCKVPPPARGGGRGRAGAPGRGAAPAAAGPRDYTVTEIPGVIAAGQKWKEVIEIEGNNADGIIATKDGGILLAQNDKSDVAKLDKNGKLSVVYPGLNTSGSVAMNSKGALFVVNRGLNESIEELAPQRKVLANKINGDPLDCAGGLNDVVADSKGGVYVTMGGLFHADANGVVTKYGQNLQPNGIILSPDEKRVYVTNGVPAAPPAPPVGTLAAFDVQPDGSLTNQREFARFEGGGGDGSTFDAAGRLYVTSAAGIQVFSPDGKVLGVIPTPHGVISLTFSGKDRKVLYAVGREGGNQAPGNKAIILTIQMIAQGPKGRGK